MSRVRGAPDGWTLAMAFDQFIEAGLPVDENRYRIAVTKVCRIPRIGEMPSGENGGRGRLIYSVGELQAIHGALYQWIRKTPPGGM